MKIQISNEILDKFSLINSEYLVDERWYSLRSGRQEYRLYSYLSTFYNNCVILDIGTYYGTSAIALSHNSSNKIISYNIKNEIPLDHKIRSVKNIEFRVKNVLNDLNSEFIKNVKVILIDIDHYGKNEENILQKLRDLNYSGVILLDDIHHPDAKMKVEMEKLWNNIPEEKFDVTKYGHHSGTGIVLFNTKSVFEFV